MFVFFSQVDHRHSIVKEELVNGYKNFNRTMCKIVCHSLMNFTLHTSHKIFVCPNPNVESYRPYIVYRTSVIGRRFGPHKKILAWRPDGIYYYKETYLLTSKIHYSVLTLNWLPQLVPHPQTSRWVRPSSETVIPRPADWAQQSEGTTLRTTGLATLVCTTVVTSLKVSLIQHEERPHQYCLQQLHRKVTQHRLH